MNLDLPSTLSPEASSPAQSNLAKAQVSSADILSEAHSLKQAPFKASKQTIQDLEELRSFQQAKRRDYEQHLNKNRLNYGQWIRYAKWELEHNHDYKRARSIMERALQVNSQHVPFWVRYIELELLHRNVNHARNVLERGVTTLPYTDKLWYMYVQTEETLGNYNSVRKIFERWISWKPAKAVWDSYIGFEKRYDEYDNVRALFTRYLAEYPHGDVWLRWADFERLEVPPSESSIPRIRGVFEAAMDALFENGTIETDTSVSQIILRWTSWEASQGETDRARQIFLTALEKGMIKSESQKSKIYQVFADFEKMFGTSSSIDSSVAMKRRIQYEEEVTKNPRDYNAWWEYIKAEEHSSVETLRDLFRRSISTHPEEKYKSLLWRRYVFLWIKFALWEEFSNRDIERARSIWTDALALIPHARFTFAKIWIMAAEFELRNDKVEALTKARKLLGRALGLTSKHTKSKIFRFYIQLESRLNGLKRVRLLYNKWIEAALIHDSEHPESRAALGVLKEFIFKEQQLGEVERCISLYEMAIDLPFKDEVEVKLSFEPRGDLFDAFITFLKEELLYDRARQEFRKEIDRNASLKLWIEFANFESSILSPDQIKDLENATDDEEFQLGDYQKEKSREVFNEAVKHFRQKDDARNCIAVLNAWKQYEEAHGDVNSVAKVEGKFPKEITKRRATDSGEEVYTEYEFPQETPNLNKFLANARKWALQSNS
ncbi:hypothetical protein FDK38_002798 [Candidozyma auris]|nr:hypothetical protein FDK38_002798 [[Candida] auris]